MTKCERCQQPILDGQPRAQLMKHAFHGQCLVEWCEVQRKTVVEPPLLKTGKGGESEIGGERLSRLRQKKE